MAFTVYGEIEVDGKSAKVEIKGVGDELKKAAAGADQFTFKGKGAAGAAQSLGQQNTFAAGSVANLGAQFNDIGVMLAAGQNPLQLAIQQGTQITQVFGNAGAAARVNMLKQAFASVISPVNLLTIGVIAGGATLAQWGIRAATAGRESRSFTEIIDDLDAAMTEYKQSADLASLSTAELEERFGTANEGLRTSIQLLLAISQSEAQQNIDATAQALSSLFEINGDGDQRAALAEFFDVNIGLAFTQSQREARSEARQLTAEFRSQQVELKQANGDLDEQISILTRMLATAQDLANAKDGVSAAEEQIIKQIAEALTKMEEQRGAVEKTSDSTQDLVRYFGDLLSATQSNIGPVQTLNAEVAAMAGNVWNAVEGMTAFLQKQAEQQAAAIRYAQSSGRYSGRGGDPRQFDSENRFGGQFIPSPEVEARADALIRSWQPKTSTARRSGGRSSGISDAQRERDAVQDLISTLQEQLDVVRATDEVQKEMIRNRDVLAAATDAERQSVEELIRTRIEEEAAIASATERAELFSTTAYDALMSVRKDGGDTVDVILRIASAFEEAAWQATLLGEGPLADIMGVGGGGVLGLIGSLIFPSQAKADGGPIYGRGGPRDDKELVWMSPGEYAVNARAASRNRAALDYINSGGLMSGPGFADGGIPIPVATPSGGGGAGGGAKGFMTVRILPSPMFRTEIVETSQGVFAESMEAYREQVLPGDVAQISNDPARVG